MSDKNHSPLSSELRPQFEARLRELLAAAPASSATPWDAPTGFMNKRDLIVYIGGQPGASDIPDTVVASVVEAVDDRGFVQSARLCGSDSVLVAVARSCVEGNIGCFVLDDEVPSMESVFMPANGGAIITVAPEFIDELADQLDDIDVPYTALGQVGGSHIIASGEPDNMTYIDLSLEAL